MPNDIPKHLLDECRTIQEDSTYNAEIHHVIAARASRVNTSIKISLAAISAISGTSILLGSPRWLAGLAILSGFMSALAGVLDIDRRKNEHVAAAKGFTVLKHEARSLHETFGSEMEHRDLTIAVRRLRDRYNDLAQHAPMTTNSAFNKARQRIKAGMHTTDFKEETRKPV